MEIIAILVILCAFYWIVLRKRMQPDPTPMQTYSDTVKQQINEHVGENLCYRVDVSSIGMLFEELEGGSGSYMVTAFIRNQNVKETFSVLTEDFGAGSAKDVSKSIIRKIEEDAFDKEIVGC